MVGIRQDYTSHRRLLVLQEHDGLALSFMFEALKVNSFAGTNHLVGQQLADVVQLFNLLTHFGDPLDVIHDLRLEFAHNCHSL